MQRKKGQGRQEGFVGVKDILQYMFSGVTVCDDRSNSNKV